MKYFNICSKRTITTSEGEKHLYNKIGIIKVTENGGWFMQLYQQPETDFQIFPSHDQKLPVIEA